MKFALPICNFLIFLSSVNCIFPNNYPEVRQIPLNDSDDPGQPLYLTEYIESGKIKEARRLAKVNHPVFFGVEHYTGFFTVNKTFNSNLFSWFIPSESDPVNDPFVLWLQGGPGTSSLFGLFCEHGPFQMKNEHEIVLRKYSWSKSFNMLYIDSPVGTGFSFTDDGGYAKDEVQVGGDLYNALQQFFKLFPEFKKNEFYVTGESYAGKYVPAIAYTIHKNNPSASLKINLKGLAIGNGWIDPYNQMEYGEYLYQHGLVDKNTRDEMNFYRDRSLKLIDEKKYSEARIDNNKILEVFTNKTGFTFLYNYLKPNGHNDQLLMEAFVQRVDIREAIHVGKIILHNSTRVSKGFDDDVCQTITPWLVELLSNYRVMLYSGGVDIMVNYALTVNFLEKLEFSAANEYKTAPRHNWYVKGKLAGFSKVAGNLTDVLVLNAGHMVPTDQPVVGFDLIRRFIRNIPFDHIF